MPFSSAASEQAPDAVTVRELREGGKTLVTTPKKGL